MQPELPTYQLETSIWDAKMCHVWLSGLATCPSCVPATPPHLACCSSVVISPAEHLEHLHVSDCVFDFRTASSPDRAEQKIRGLYWGGNEWLWHCARCQQIGRVTRDKRTKVIFSVFLLTLETKAWISRWTPTSMMPVSSLVLWKRTQEIVRLFAASKC